jgi:hypothetical protein
MSTATNWTAYAWKDDEGRVRYVGCGPYAGSHPAIAKWKDRDADNSELHIWLQSIDREPEREVCGSTLMPKQMARALTAIYRQRYSETLLSTRGSASYHGGGTSRAVIYCPTDDVFGLSFWKSVRKAAEHCGCNASNITRKCQNVNNEEWVFADDDI